MSSTYKIADKLLDRLTREGDPNGTLVNKLLRQFFRGYPLEKLRPLLRGKDRGARASAAWIASELGKRARPLMSDVVPLLKDTDLDTRIAAIDVVHVCAGPEDGEIIVAVIEMMEDPDVAIRTRVIYFVSEALRPQIQASINACSPGSVHVEPLRMVGTVASAWERRQVRGHVAELESASDASASLLPSHAYREWTRSILKDASPLRRRYAVAAALRITDVDESLLVLAGQSTDNEITNIARRHLEMQRR